MSKSEVQIEVDGMPYGRMSFSRDDLKVIDKKLFRNAVFRTVREAADGNVEIAIPERAIRRLRATGKTDRQSRRRRFRGQGGNQRNRQQSPTEIIG